MAAEILPEARGEVRRDRLKLVEPAKAAPDAAPAGVEARRAGETAPEADSPSASKPSPRRSMIRRAGLALVGTALLGAGLWFGADWWFNGRFIVSTDDAYVGAEMATISAKLSANVTSVSVTQNQEVKAGQPLVALDDGDRAVQRLARGATDQHVLGANADRDRRPCGQSACVDGGMDLRPAVELQQGLRGLVLRPGHRVVDDRVLEDLVLALALAELVPQVGCLGHRHACVVEQDEGGDPAQ